MRCPGPLKSRAALFTLLICALATCTGVAIYLLASSSSSPEASSLPRCWLLPSRRDSDLIDCSKVPGPNLQSARSCVLLEGRMRVRCVLLPGANDATMLMQTRQLDRPLPQSGLHTDEVPVVCSCAVQLVTVLGHDAACGESRLPESCCMLVTIIPAKRCHCRMAMPKQVLLSLSYLLIFIFIHSYI